VLSAILGNYADLAVVTSLLVINAVLSFMQEHRAAGVVGCDCRPVTSYRQM